MSVILDPAKIPFHIAIIPDGNRRWSKKRAASVQEGHSEGADILMDVLKEAKNLGVKVMTFYAFSTENWSRHPDEVAGLMVLIESYLKNQIPHMQQEGIRFNTLGHIAQLPQSLQEVVEEAKNSTSKGNAIDFILALNYGGRDELVRACRKIAVKVASKELLETEIDEELITSALDTAGWPDPDLLIRTSGESRLSNFLLWQLSYAELYITPVLWPDFRPAHLQEAVADFQKRQRRRGGDA